MISSCCSTMFSLFHSTQVLNTLEKNAVPSATKPFPVEAQYVKSILAARGSDGDEDDDKENQNTPKPKPRGKKPRSTKKTKGKPKCVKKNPDDIKPEWNYSSIRNQFIQAMRSQGASHAQAVKCWDCSLEKAKFLAPVSVPELRKRRFLEKGSQTNPWRERRANNAPTN